MNKLYILPVVLVTILIGLLFFKKEEVFIIVSQPVITSSINSSSIETLSYSFLTNQPDRYEFNLDYIIKAEITTEERYFPIEIKSIKKTSYEKILKDETFNLIVIEYKPSLLIDKGLIQYESANMIIHYENNKELIFDLGEFNYAFNEETTDLSLGSLKATSETIKEVNSIGGIYLELGNQTNEAIRIETIDILSLTIKANQDAIVIYDEPLDYKDSVKDVLGVARYDFFTDTMKRSINTVVQSKQSVQLYVPLLYLGDIYHVGRIGLIVTYTLNGETKTTYIDDFPFMRYDLYDDALKENWVTHYGD